MIRETGLIHLVWIGRFQFFLLGLGGVLWLLRSWHAAVVFAIGGAASLGFWYSHKLIIGKLLNPSVRFRWAYGIGAILKLVFIGLVLHWVILFFPLETLPLVTGILLFVSAILLEAGRLILDPESGIED